MSLPEPTGLLIATAGGVLSVISGGLAALHHYADWRDRQGPVRDQAKRLELAKLRLETLEAARAMAQTLEVPPGAEFEASVRATIEDVANLMAPDGHVSATRAGGPTPAPLLRRMLFLTLPSSVVSWVARLLSLAVGGLGVLGGIGVLIAWKTDDPEWVEEEFLYSGVAAAMFVVFAMVFYALAVTTDRPKRVPDPE